MSQSIGDYYANKDREAREISALLEHAKTWRGLLNAAITDGVYGTAALAKQLADSSAVDIRRLERALERARDTGGLSMDLEAQVKRIEGEVERRLTEHLELLSLVRRLSMNLRSVSLIGGADPRRTALCDEADALVRRVGGKR